MHRLRPRATWTYEPLAPFHQRRDAHPDRWADRVAWWRRWCLLELSWATVLAVGAGAVLLGWARLIILAGFASLGAQMFLVVMASPSIVVGLLLMGRAGAAWDGWRKGTVNPRVIRGVGWEDPTAEEAAVIGAAVRRLGEHAEVVERYWVMRDGLLGGASYGTEVAIDQAVIERGEDHVVALLAHELGHVHLRHSYWALAMTELAWGPIVRSPSWWRRPVHQLAMRTFGAQARHAMEFQAEEYAAIDCGVVDELSLYHGTDNDIRPAARFLGFDQHTHPSRAHVRDLIEHRWRPWVERRRPRPVKAG